MNKRWFLREVCGSLLRMVNVDMFLLFFRDLYYRVCVLARQTERDIETESEKSPPRGDGHAAIPSPPFSSWDLGHARIRAQREL